MLILLKNAHVS